MKSLSHEALWRICQRLPSDYEPYGDADRDAAAEQGRLDCSSGCRWYHELAGIRGLDWGVCCNPESERHGLLTYEHQGCWHFESETGEARDELDAEG